MHLTVEPAEYNSFFEEFTDAFIKRALEGETIGRTKYSRLNWTKSKLNFQSIPVILFAPKGDKTFSPEYFWVRWRNYSQKNIAFNINAEAYKNALQYLDFTLPEDFKGKTEYDKAKVLSAAYRTARNIIVGAGLTKDESQFQAIGENSASQPIANVFSNQFESNYIRQLTTAPDSELPSIRLRKEIENLASIGDNGGYEDLKIRVLEYFEYGEELFRIKNFFDFSALQKVDVKTFWEYTFSAREKQILLSYLLNDKNSRTIQNNILKIFAIKGLLTDEDIINILKSSISKTLVIRKVPYLLSDSNNTKFLCIGLTKLALLVRFKKNHKDLPSFISIVINTLPIMDFETVPLQLVKLADHFHDAQIRTRILFSLLIFLENNFEENYSTELIFELREIAIRIYKTIVVDGRIQLGVEKVIYDRIIWMLNILENKVLGNPSDYNRTFKGLNRFSQFDIEIKTKFNKYPYFLYPKVGTWQERWCQL